MEARTKGTSPARPSRVAPSTAERLKKTAAERPAGDTDVRGGDGDGARSTKGGAARGKRRQRPPRPGDTPVDVATLEGSWLSRLNRVPGGTQALFGLVMVVMVTGLVSFTNVFISAADKRELGNDAKPTLTAFEAFGTGEAVLRVGVPLLIAVIGVGFSFHPQRRRIWLGAAVLLGLSMTLTGLPFYLFAAGFFAYAVYRASKVEGPNEPLVASLRSRRRARSAGGTEVEVGGDPSGDVDEDADIA